MISQADIIRTLINKNCTDESVMSTALSPDCTPPKLLEKLTETERFDLALDLSMKLGLDVMPLWRTWALRCLCNRNFQAAREKFRHCFVRLRLPSGRTSPIQSSLLSDILSHLSKMDNRQLPLAEEIELIVNRQVSDDSLKEGSTDGASLQESIKSKSEIYAECMHYLTSYGSTTDFVKFYVQNYLWDEAVKLLIEKPNQIKLDKFFINDVVLYSASLGCLSNLVAAFLALDPDIVLSSNHFKAIYNFCLRQRRYNLLYYFQNSIGDHIAAANTQIKFFFLKRPVKSYRDLNHRIASLTKARKNYQDYLDKTSNLIEASPSRGTSSSLFTFIPKEDVEKQIKLIYLQIDITRNFALNEVSGCINGIDIEAKCNGEASNISELPDDYPVTLFENDERRKTFLAALVLVYFDLSCSSYLSKYGLDLACQLIKDYELDKIKVFKTAMRIIIDDESCDILENAKLLLERIREDFLATSKEPKKIKEPVKSLSASKSGRNKGLNSSHKTNDSKQIQPVTSTTPEDQIRAICDEVIRDSIGNCREADYQLELAKLLSNEAKIKHYLEQGKLSQAQRLACSLNRPDYVMNIIEEAGKLNQNHVRAVCQLWLANYETKNLIRK